MIIQFAPSGIKTEIKSIEMYQGGLTDAIPGDHIGFNVKNVSVKDLKRGYVASDYMNDPAKECISFIA